uniref:Peptidase S1 domain-containing protein n=1 Tax=Glossina brevipalpis TaxID=37001 RepID=A0A1A9WH00_9MUSC
MGRKCAQDLANFQGRTSFAESIVLVHCKVSKRMTRQFGVILSQDAILTANTAMASECYATYSDTIDGGIVEGLMEASYNSSSPFKHLWKLPQLKIILTKQPLKIASERIPVLPKEPYKENDTCVVVSLDRSATNHTFKIVEKQVNFIKWNECERILSSLHQNVLCLQAPKIFCNMNHHKEYIEGSPLLCNGILTGIVGEIIINDITYPTQCAKIYEARQWIKSNMELISRDNAFERNIVAVGYLVENKSIITSLGILLAKNRILTSNVPDLSRKRKNYSLKSGELISDGFIEYNKNKQINWKKMKSFKNILSPNVSELQMTIIKLKSNIDYGSRPIKKIPMARRKPTKNATCTLISTYPYWIKLEIDVLNRIDCLEELYEFDHNYMCIRPKYGGKLYENLYTGTPVICDGALIGLIVQIDYSWENKPIPMVPVYKYKQWIRKTMEELGANAKPEITVQGRGKDEIQGLSSFTMPQLSLVKIFTGVSTISSILTPPGPITTQLLVPANDFLGSDTISDRSVVNSISEFNFTRPICISDESPTIF